MAKGHCGKVPISGVGPQGQEGSLQWGGAHIFLGAGGGTHSKQKTSWWHRLSELPACTWDHEWVKRSSQVLEL